MKISKKDVIIEQQNEIIAEYENLLSDLLDVFQFNKIQENSEYKEFTQFTINECKNLQYKLNKIERVK